MRTLLSRSCDQSWLLACLTFDLRTHHRTSQTLVHLTVALAASRLPCATAGGRHSQCCKDSHRHAPSSDRLPSTVHWSEAVRMFCVFCFFCRFVRASSYCLVTTSLFCMMYRVYFSRIHIVSCKNRCVLSVYSHVRLNLASIPIAILQQLSCAASVHFCFNKYMSLCGRALALHITAACW